MENQEVYKISLAGEKSELVIIHKEGFDELRPEPVKITGNIDSVSNWLLKRFSKEASPDAKNYISGDTAHVLINRDKMTISLIVNENDPYYKGSITGALTKHPDFEKWEINTGHEFDNKTLSEFIKMNRSCFESKSHAMRLSAELSMLKVKVDNEVEKANDNRGNVRQMFAQKVIEMNIPKSFLLKVPVFKGQPTAKFEVEIYVNPNNYMVSLVSPEANDIISSIRDFVIDEQKNLINEISPVLAIIEQ